MNSNGITKNWVSMIVLPWVSSFAVQMPGLRGGLTVNFELKI